MAASRKYVVKLGDVTVFGPETDYQKVLKFMSSVDKESRKQHKIFAETESVVAAPAAAAPRVQPTVRPVVKAAPVAAPRVQPTVRPAVKAQPAAIVEEEVVESAEFSDFTSSAQAFSNYVTSGGASDLWKPKDGKQLIRILPLGGALPPDWKMPFPMLASGVHPRMGESLQDSVICPKLTYGRACPICNFVWKLWGSNNPEDKALSKQMRAYKRVLANVLVLNELDKGVQKFAFGKKLLERIMSYLSAEDTKQVLHPELGSNFILEKRQLDGYANYDTSRFENRIVPLSSLYPNWRAEIHDLKKEIVEKTHDELAAVLKETQKALLMANSGWPTDTAVAVDPTNFGAVAGVIEEEIVEISPEDISASLDNLQ